MVYSAVIKDLGAQGDALVSVQGKDFYIPFVLPGEEVEFIPIGNNRGQVTKFMRASPNRIQPICSNYAQCGGCKFQHFNQESYLQFKKDSLIKTLRQKGINADVADVVVIPPHTRQRVSFSSVATGNSHWFGFKSIKSDKIVAINECPLLDSKLEVLIHPLKKQCISITGSVAVTLAKNGFDVLITSGNYPDLSFLQNLSEFAYGNDVMRVSWRSSEFDIPEKLLGIETPLIEIGSKMLPLPAGVFLQASKESQKILSDLVINMVRESGFEQQNKLADLFCGLGSLTIPLKDAFDSSVIIGYDSFAPSINELNKILPATIQDLFRNPLPADKLNNFDVVVLDPPRAGAIEQVKQLAVSNVENIVYVSCNPASFARDAKELLNAGYVVTDIVPVDQFIFSVHLEIVARFTKNKP